jgi:hypothetical protein
MGQINPALLFAVGVAVAAIFFRPWMLDALVEAINNFRGGPPTPMHPSPADDGALLRKRARKSALKL